MRIKRFFPIAILLLMAHSSLSLAAEKFEPNYDESKVPEYTLPDPLVLSNSEKVTDAKTWKEVRRPEILNLFAEEVYGKTPEAPDLLRYQVIETSDEALNGKAIRKQVRIFFTQDKADPKMDLLIYLPKGAEKPVPLM
ncbi:MAG: acetylxylan esterase, partial [Candidatus Omnitrophica bacterium]|nr:acetylxylan esterase [Candidatus Omnitrophota bacterium]